VALYYWLSGKVTSKEPTYPFTTRQIALFLAAVSCAIRPTGAILWIYIGLIELLETDKKIQLLLEAFFIGYASNSEYFIMLGNLSSFAQIYILLLLLLFSGLPRLGPTVLWTSGCMVDGYSFPSIF
jgi:hypothetical protein